jgi:hypothetical protein
MESSSVYRPMTPNENTVYLHAENSRTLQTGSVRMRRSKHGSKMRIHFPTCGSPAKVRVYQTSLPPVTVTDIISYSRVGKECVDVRDRHYHHALGLTLTGQLLLTNVYIALRRANDLSSCLISTKPRNEQQKLSSLAS